MRNDETRQERVVLAVKVEVGEAYEQAEAEGDDASAEIGQRDLKMILRSHRMRRVN